MNWHKSAKKNLEQLSKDSRCLSLICEQLDISRDTLVLPCIITEKEPCKLLDALSSNQSQEFSI